MNALTSDGARGFSLSSFGGEGRGEEALFTGHQTAQLPSEMHDAMDCH
jgi:hypothetical protein